MVKSFGAELREDDRLRGVLAKWKKRTYRTWMRHTYSSSGQILALIILRTAVIGLALHLWWTGQASAGDVAYVMTAYVVIQGYLRDIGMYIRDLQKSVNDMEELVEIHAQPLGIEDKTGAKPIAIRHGRIEFQDVIFTTAAIISRCTTGSASPSARARRSGWSASRAPARPRS